MQGTEPRDTEKDPRQFTFDDWGWVVMSLGMGIGAGIAFAPIPAGMCGIWVFLVIALIGYIGIYAFQKLFIQVMCSSDENLPYTDFLTKKMGKIWGRLTGLLYLTMLTIWFLVYSEAVVKDSASFLKSFGILTTDLSGNIFYITSVVAVLVLIAASGEKVLFKIASLLSVSILIILILLGCMMIPLWSTSNIPATPPPEIFARDGLWLLPFVLTSILFLQSLSPMVVWFRNNSQTREIALYRAKRAHFIAFIMLAVIVFFYVVSFSFAVSQENSKVAFDDNISALALLAKVNKGVFLRILELILDIFAVMTSFFSIYLSLRETLVCEFSRIYKRFKKPILSTHNKFKYIIPILLITVGVTVILTNAPILVFTTICSPIFGIVGCLIPALLVIKLPELKKYRNPRLGFVILIGILLCMAPFADYLVRRQIQKNEDKIESHDNKKNKA